MPAKTTTLTLVALLLTLAPGSAQAWSQSGTVLVGAFDVGIDASVRVNGDGFDGLTGDHVVLPAGAAGADFTLVATGGLDGVFGPPDFDICFKSSTGADLGCHLNPGDEAGTVPTGAVVAWVYLFDGVDASYTLTIG